MKTALCASLCLAAGMAAAAPEWDVRADTWAATDGLGRALPSFADAGPARRDRTVGIFYFLWLDERSDRGPYDITRILAADPGAMRKPDSPLWGPPYWPHYWGEPLFGYYLSTDEAVIRKHAQMLSDAGVDVVFFDVTNGPTYPASYTALMRAFAEVRSHGNRTPRIAFLCPFGQPDLDSPRGKVLTTLWNAVYKPRLHPELWFQWEGKPLILADPSPWRGGLAGEREHDTPDRLLPGKTLRQSFTSAEPVIGVSVNCPTWFEQKDSGVTLTLFRGSSAVAKKTFSKIADNSWPELMLGKPLPAGEYAIELSAPKGTIGWWRNSKTGRRSFTYITTSDANAEMVNFFTFRPPVASYFSGPGERADCWSWLEVFPQHVFCNSRGEKEMMSVGVAQNAVGNRLGSMSEKNAKGRSWHNGAYDSRPGIEPRGMNFAEQWGRALKEDPRFLFITGWNEWIVGRFNEFSGVREPVMFVDEFDMEHSRDCEPMKGGHGDSYYYQLIAGIRRYKGVRELPRVRSAPIRIDGDFRDWAEAAPEFRDTLGDPVHRDAQGYGKAGPYVNQTGRADLRSAKASAIADAICFYVRVEGELPPQASPNWMLLYIDADQNAQTGWLGYDFLVDSGRLKRNAGGYSWRDAGPVALKAGASEIELAVPLAAFGGKCPNGVDFKWADGIRQTGDWSDFTLNGDAAPNDRYNFRALF